MERVDYSRITSALMLSALCVRGVRQLGEFDEQQLPHCTKTSVSRPVKNTPNCEYPACFFSLILHGPLILFAHHISIDALSICVRGVRQLGEFDEQQLPHVYYTSVRGLFLQLFQLCQDAALQPDNLSELQEYFL